MDTFVVYELFTVDAETAEDAQAQAASSSSRAPSVIVAGASLRELAHPVHLADANAAFGHIGAGGKVAPEDRDEKVVREDAEAELDG